MKYAPGPVPGDSKQLQNYLQTEFRKIQDTIDQIHLRETLHVVPDKPQDGQVEYADGTNWNPGAGEGPYMYYNSQWNGLMTLNYALEVGKGNISGTSGVNKFGRNTDVDTSAEDIWDGGGTWTAPTASRTHDIVSTDTNDTSAGTGARTVEIQGLDANWALQTETVTMNGTSNVATASTYRRIFRMKVLTAGSGGANAGTITATAQTDSTVTAQMSIGNNQTLMAIYTVPASKTAYMTQLYASINRAVSTTEADIFLWVRDAETPGPWQLKHVQSITTTGDSRLAKDFEPYFSISEKSDVRVAGVANDLNSDISAGFDLYLVDN